MKLNSCVKRRTCVLPSPLNKFDLFDIRRKRVLSADHASIKGACCVDQHLVGGFEIVDTDASSMIRYLHDLANTSNLAFGGY
jgi:hypothetical protein